MKKLFLLSIISIVFISCRKEDEPILEFRAKIKVTAQLSNRLYEEGHDSVYVYVSGQRTFSFKTHNDPCLNISYGYMAMKRMKSYSEPYIVSTERDTIESGILYFDTISSLKVIY